MHVGVVVFPGANCDRDVGWALAGCLGWRVTFLWHQDRTLPKLDALVLPGGFSHGDYLRCGAIASSAPCWGPWRISRPRGAGAGHLQRFSSVDGSRPAAWGADAQQGPSLHVSGSGLAGCRLPLPLAGPLCPGGLPHLAHCPREGCYTLILPACINWRTTAKLPCATWTIPMAPLVTLPGEQQGRQCFGAHAHPERACDQATGGTDGQMLFRGLVNWTGVS